MSCCSWTLPNNALVHVLATQVTSGCVAWTMHHDSQHASAAVHSAVMVQAVGLSSWHGSSLIVFVEAFCDCRAHMGAVGNSSQENI